MRIPFWRWPQHGPVRRGLFFAMLEGAVVSGMFVALEVWMVPLVQTCLAAPAFVIGLLTLVPQLGMLVLSPWTRRIIAWHGGPRAAALVSCWWQIACLALLSLPLHARDAVWALPLAVALISVIGVSNVIASPAWIAWTSTFVPRLISGRYQARRMWLFNIVKLGFAAAFAGCAHLWPLAEEPWGMQAILVCAVVSRLISLCCLAQQPYLERRVALPALSSQRTQLVAAGFTGFLRQLTSSDAGRWTLVWSSFVGGVMVGGPFFASYMIASREQGGLALDPLWYSALIYTSVVARILFFPLVGRMVDLFGARAVLRSAVCIILCIPIPWVLTSNPWWLVATEVVAGIAWAGAEIAIGALLFAAHPDPERRAEISGYFNCIAAAGIIAGTAIGSLLIELAPSWLGNHYHTVFLVSVLLRLPGVLLAIRWLPGLRPLDERERHHLVQALPGVELVSAFGRGLNSLFRQVVD
ncbi:MAG: MFS transporter [Planctomycetes bacterium]|nr:MFS transporter [Planctomycetota bacterium]